jgi:hypothetical protein
MTDEDLRARFLAAALKFDDDQLGIVEKFGRQRSYKDGQVLIEAGTRDPNFSVIRSGEVEVVEYSAGRPQIIWKSNPKEFPGGALLLGAGLAPNAPVWTPGRQDAYRLLPGARIQRLRDLLDNNSRRRGDG